MAKTTAASEMGLREFRNGGYQMLTEPTVITWHGKPVGLWTPVGYRPIADAGEANANWSGYVTSTPTQTTSVVRAFSASTTLPSWLKGDTSGKGK